MWVCSLLPTTQRACVVLCFIFVVSGSTTFVRIISKKGQFSEEKLLNIKWGLFSSTTFVWNISHSKQNSARYHIIWHEDVRDFYCILKQPLQLHKPKTKRKKASSKELALRRKNSGIVSYKPLQNTSEFNAFSLRRCHIETPMLCPVQSCGGQLPTSVDNVITVRQFLSVVVSKLTHKPT